MPTLTRHADAAMAAADAAVAFLLRHYSLLSIFRDAARCRAMLIFAILPPRVFYATPRCYRRAAAMAMPPMLIARHVVSLRYAIISPSARFAAAAAAAIARSACRRRHADITRR
jgi:hypothetical protein